MGPEGFAAELRALRAVAVAYHLWPGVVPGGFIGVHTGLLSASESESEVASVLAHEVAHVTQRHIARMLGQQQQMQLPVLAALAVLAVFAALRLSRCGRGGEVGPPADAGLDGGLVDGPPSLDGPRAIEGFVQDDLGNALSRLGRHGEARLYYERVLTEFPDSEYAQSAKRRLESLKA